ncbi:7450_t:CDS:1, partial [Racocetra persica]
VLKDLRDMTIEFRSKKLPETDISRATSGTNMTKIVLKGNLTQV